MDVRRRQPLGVELVKRNIVSEGDIEQALKYQKEHPNKKIGDIINILQLCDTEKLIEAMGEIFGVKGIILKPDDIKIMSMIMDIKKLYIGMALIGYIFMAIGFLISVFVKSSKKATPIALGVFFASYVIGIFSKLQDRLSGFIYLSPFDYAPPSEIIKNGFEAKFIVIGLSIIVVSIVITYTIYNKKDFNI